ncbi:MULTISPECIES: ABC transporter substrate-binding protein [unclassified Oceanispirochaeta]|uniref:ABC transporter substrate-binding protein n=1 Tax=unclassified Oceanispirochaeta TaxID=2635722 RepID=UPI000E09D827|nr:MULTISPECIES: extracellular solute-binding protein [unclassified Oceanispirochaeta]MBF9014581.1 extracellular solute-binding protein [Oceanispirochaeta sp. M2]NPD70837.1 extracellular solute-binding protein [Oceanispirochaeta sp. M1]RDG34118.1 extracellular solute-binding protein [Oceanispirochaeta sp. M1]
MINKKRILSSTLLLLMVALVSFSVIGCKKEEAPKAAEAVEAKVMARTDYAGDIVVWSFTDELQDMIPMFEEEYPGIKVEFVVIPNADEVYLNKINTTLRSRSATPDAFTGEAAFYKQFINAGYWEPISKAPYNAEDLVKDLVPYVPNSSRNADGEITALSWQATPGALFYRRGLAREVLGTDDPAEVSKWTSDLNKFYELGEKVKETTNGEKYLLAGFSDMSQFIFNLRDTPYIVDNKLVIPQGMLDYMKIAKDMRDNGIESGTTTWQPPWFSSMKDGSVMCYILPTWGLHYVLKPNAEPEADKGEKEFSGDWGLAVPPASYSWGGTWIGINALSEKKDLAWEIVKYLGSDEGFLEKWAKKTGDFVSNTKVIEKITPTFSEPFLGGQNHYEYFAAEANKIDVSHRGPWDFQIENAWGDQVSLYASGNKSFDDAVEDFKKAVSEILPDVDVQ